MHSTGIEFYTQSQNEQSHWPVFVFIVGAVLSYYGLVYEVGGLWLQRSFLRQDRRAQWMQRAYFTLRRLRLVAPFVLPNLKAERLMKKPLRVGFKIRLWAEADRDACQKLYHLNAPGRFPDGVEEDLEQSMTQSPASLLVIEKEGRVIACGGVKRGATTATLFFGLIHPEYQRQGLGRLLLIARLCRLTLDHAITIHICAVADSVGYYETFGFERFALWISEDGVGHPMAGISFHPQQRERLATFLEQAGYPVLPPVTPLPVVPASDQR